MAQSAPIAATRYIVTDFVGSVLAFPLWWYTRGLSLVVRRAIDSVHEVSAYFALGVWMRNLFVPMYGDTSIWGRLISFGVRLFMIVARGFAVAIWSGVAVLLVVVYAVALPVAVLGVLFHSGGMLVTL